MNTNNYVNELKRLPLPPKLRDKYRRPDAWNKIIDSLDSKSDIGRSNAFNLKRQSFYEQYINEIGYLPSEFIMKAVAACAVSLRTISQWDDYDPEKC